VQLSDFHYDPYFSIVPLKHALQVVPGLNPDLIVLTGDFVTVPAFGSDSQARHAAAAAEPCAALLAGLRARLGVFAVLGNHDGASDVARIVAALRAHGIEVLRNRAVELPQDGARLWLAGVDDVLEGVADLKKTLRGVPRDEAVVLLAHEPDFALETAQTPVDLQLSGHSHGGQVRVPFIGAPWLPPLARKFPRGMYHIGDLTLYTNLGLGTVRVPARWNCPPEITLITLRQPAVDQKQR